MKRVLESFQEEGKIGREKVGSCVVCCLGKIKNWLLFCFYSKDFNIYPNDICLIQMVSTNGCAKELKRSVSSVGLWNIPNQ